MNQGALWFDVDKKEHLSEKDFRDAIAYYIKKKHDKPDMCYVNKKCYNGVAVKGLTIETTIWIMPHHIWIGKEMK